MPRRPQTFTRPLDFGGEVALDAALAASFPASDPVAALTPAAERSSSIPGRPSRVVEAPPIRLSQKKDARP